MIHNKFRFIMTLVALFAISTGVWAQSYEAKVFDVPASWASDETILSPADLPEDFVQITFDEAKALAVPDGNVILIYGFNGDKVKTMFFESGTYISNSEDEGRAPRGDFIMFQTINAKICYPAIHVTEITKNQWQFTMPAGNVELQVEYYPGMLTFGTGAIEGGTLEVVGLGLGTTSFTAPSDWDKNSTRLASSHFEGFKSVTEEEAKAWPGVPATGLVALFYNYDETEQKWDMIYFKDGAFGDIYKGYVQQLATIYNLLDDNFSVFYTTGMQMPAGFEKDEEGNIYVEPGTKFQVKAVPDEGYHLVSLTNGTNDIEVDADGIATITMPDEYADLTLTATFSNEYTVALNAEGLSDEEAAAWKAATGDNAPAAFPLENVKYGTEVKVTYGGTKKVIGVKAEKKVEPKKLTVGNVTFYYDEGQTFTEAKQKYADLNSGWILNGPYISVQGSIYIVLFKGEPPVEGTSKIEPNAEYSWIDFS